MLIMTVAAAVVVVTAESSLTAKSQQAEEDLRAKTGRVGGPMLLWRDPGNTRGGG